jgi:hypothetical protein
LRRCFFSEFLLPLAATRVIETAAAISVAF